MGDLPGLEGLGHSSGVERICERSADEKPNLIVGRESDLRLRSWFGANRTIAQTGAVAAGAIPLRETTASSGAENFYAHEKTI
jgi:hypothetical protein